MKNVLSSVKTIALALSLGALVISTAEAGPREDIVAGFAAEAKAANPAFAGFDPAAGAAMFTQHYGTGKPDTPKCTTCHGTTPQSPGETRAGKPIDPIAASATPSRFTDPAKVAKWFRRNCTGVIGRECTAQEKGDFLTYMIGQ